MAKWLHTCLCVLLSLSSLLASGPTIERDDLAIPVRAPKSVIPGQFETFILELSNDYDFTLNFHITVDKPKSWRFLSPLENVSLAPGEKKTVIFLMDIDRACEIGKKDIRFEFFDKDHQVKIEQTVVTNVENIHELEARAVRYPSHLMSGEDFEVEFLVRNRGNCYEEVKVTSENGSVNVAELMMPPNSSYHVKVKQRVPDLKYVGYVASDIVLETDSNMLPLRERISIKAFPKVTKRTDPYHRFPIDASLIYFGAKTAQPYSAGFQVEVEGKGHIDRKDNHHLYFKTRGPSQFSLARVGNYDQYSLKYEWQQSRTSMTRISVGDFAYNLTPITEMYRWARGVGVHQTLRKVEIGGFYNQPIFIEDIKQQFAGYSKFHVKDNWDIQVSGMYRQFSKNTKGQLVSLQNSLKIWEQALRAEYSFGGSGDNSGSAASFDLSGSLKKLSLSYSTQNIYASQFFPGYYTNSVFSNSHLRYRKDNLSLYAGLSYNDANPSQDTIRTVSPYSTNASFGATYYFSRDLRMTLTYVKRSKEDRFPSKKFSYREDAIRYMMGYQSNNWNVLLDGELAQTDNLLISTDNEAGTSYNIRGRLERGLGKGLQIGGFCQYLYTNRYAQDLTTYLLYGANASYRPVSNFSLAASYRNNYLIDQYNSDRSLVDVQLRGRYEQHQMSVGVSHALIRNTVDRKDFFINARYTCHINTPIRKKKGLYSLTGTIKADNQRDASGIIVHMAGQSVMSDQYGRFEFNDVEPGIHYLHIDMGSLNIGMMSKVETPLEVEVLPKERNYLNIEIVRSGSITGKIDFKGPTRLTASGEKGYNLRVVKATNGKREMLTYTDDQGNFSFMQVLPGEWTLRVVEAGSDSGEWRLKENNIKVDVNPSEHEKVVFEMNKKTRKIKFKSQQAIDLKIQKN